LVVIQITLVCRIKHLKRDPGHVRIVTSSTDACVLALLTCFLDVIALDITFDPQ